MLTISGVSVRARLEPAWYARSFDSIVRAFLLILVKVLEQDSIRLDMEVRLEGVLKHLMAR